jgi:hypothetical protein
VGSSVITAAGPRSVGNGQLDLQVNECRAISSLISPDKRVRVLRPTCLYSRLSGQVTSRSTIDFSA